MNSEKQKSRTKRSPNMIGVGLALGAGIGVALDNIAVGVAVGLAVGAALDSRRKRRSQSDSGPSVKGNPPSAADTKPHQDEE